MPRISVIVPVYNVEEYLALSLQSVRDQDWHDLEIICVNDGSTDGSAEVLRLFERADERITVVEKENGGLSSARNAGIKAASGDIVCFLDSDDLLTENACGTIVRAFDRTSADVVTYGAMAYPEFRSYPWLEEVLSPRDVDYEQFSTDILFKEQSRPFAWRTACRRDFLLESGVLFDETLPFGEDQLFHFAVYPRACRTSLISDKLVRYRVSRSGSLMNTRLHDPLKMAREHANIIRHIVADWRDGGFLARYPRELLLWTVDFLGFDILQLDEPGRTEMLDVMKGIWAESFDAATIDACAAVDDARARIVQAVWSDRSLASGNARRAVVYRYFSWKYGTRAALGRVLDVAKGSGPIGRLRESIAHSRRAEMEACHDEEAWELRDERERAAALEHVKRELGNAAPASS